MSPPHASIDTFETYRAQDPEARFTAWLRERTGETWTQATRHRFVEGMADGSIPKEVYAAYLVQDHAFIAALVDLFGYAVAKAPSIEAKRPFIEFLELVTSDETDHFERAFDALDVPETDRVEPALGETTRSFMAHLEMASRGSYADVLAVLVPVEWVYLEWGTRLAQHPPGDPVLDEWIDLHANPGFQAFVDHMREELDRIGAQAGARDRERLASLFEGVVELEVAFWEQAYALAGSG